MAKSLTLAYSVAAVLPLFPNLSVAQSAYVSDVVPDDAVLTANIERSCFGKVGVISEFIGVSLLEDAAYIAFYVVNYSDGFKVNRSPIYRLGNGKWIVECVSPGYGNTLHVVYAM